MTVGELIEELSQFPTHMEVHLVIEGPGGIRAVIDEIKHKQDGADHFIAIIG